MLTQSEVNLQHRNFVPAQRDIRLRVKLNTLQANEVSRLLLAAHPALDDLRTAGQLQFINSAGQLRIAAVRGGALPAEVTATDVQALVDAVKADMPDDAGEPVWHMNMRSHFARRGGR